jgi:hypothetical protein
VDHFVTVTEVELARARTDPAYRQRLLTASLAQLVAELSRYQRKAGAASEVGRQLREGSLLAVKLADLIGRLDRQARTRAARGD